MKEVIGSSYDEFSSRLTAVEANERIYRDYLQNCDQLKSSSDETVEGSKVPRSFFLAQEELFCVEYRLAPPPTSFDCKIKVYYSSPKGRKSYQDESLYSIEEIRHLMEQIKKERQQRVDYRRTREYERSKMTDSLRYDVMKRDRFRCVLCGATQADGVKLHVDHIRPIAKGGKTEMSNLRTLCDRCNMGKRDKYDPYGIN